MWVASDVGVEWFTKISYVIESEFFFEGSMGGGIVVHGRSCGGFDELEEGGVDRFAMQVIKFEAA